MKRLPFTDAFVDESIRGQRYLMACVLAEARHLATLRPAMADLAVYERVHFNNESDVQKRRVLEAVTRMPIRALVAVCHRERGVTEFDARNACLAQLVGDLQRRRVERLVIESRGDDSEDTRHLLRVRRPDPPLVFEHRRGSVEPMLWIADAIAWAAGAASTWRRLIDPVVETTVELRP